MSRFDGHVRDLGELPDGELTRITDKLAASPELWVTGDARFRSRHDDVQHIIFKFPDNYPASHTPSSYTEHWHDWKSLLAPLIERVAKPYAVGGCDTAKIILSRLLPGGQVPRHVDSNPSSVFPHKIHVPLITNPGISFLVEEKSYYLERGRAYELNNLVPHAVENRSASDRVHLIFEVYPLEAAPEGQSHNRAG